jgi:DNA modification methylase
MDILEKYIEQYYKKLRKGGTLILFFDLWKITDLKNLLEKYKFKQIRFIEWIKTNPQPINSKVNYLTNCREIALIGIKDSSPTFNSSYDNGIYDNDIYRFPLQGGKNRIHPTQKSLKLFETLIEKHSNENDIVMDTFLGGGTTAIASINTKRKFKGCEISKEYFDIFMKIISDMQKNDKDKKDDNNEDVDEKENNKKKVKDTKKQDKKQDNNDTSENEKQEDNKKKKIKKDKKDDIDSEDEDEKENKKKKVKDTKKQDDDKPKKKKK